MKSSLNTGFSLVEVLTAIAIATVVMVAVGAFQFNIINYNRSSAVKLTNTQEAQTILKTVVREMRSMNQSTTGTYPILAGATSSITFYSDIYSDGLKEQVRYYLSSTTLYRGEIRPTGSPLAYNGTETFKVLATGVRNASSTPMFEYFASDYTGTTTAMTYPLNLTSIRLIRVNLTIDSDPNKSPVPRTFTSQAELRNLKDNL